jgi:hypothetical protein
MIERVRRVPASSAHPATEGTKIIIGNHSVRDNTQLLRQIENEPLYE